MEALLASPAVSLSHDHQRFLSNFNGNSYNYYNSGNSFDPNIFIIFAAYGLIAALIIYPILALAAYCFDIQWLKPVVLCWPDLCEGRGCIVWRVLCCPIIFPWHAIRIFCGGCLQAYAQWSCHPLCCKGICWDEFEDHDFPPAPESIGVLHGDTASGVLYGGDATEWRRASEVAGKDSQGHGAQLFQGEIEADDLLQGRIGDCWLIAALACVAERPEILQQVIGTKTVDPRGKYTFYLWNQIKNQKGNKWEQIVIDDYIPVDPKSNRPKFAQAHGNEIWAMLIEKAFAKMYGSYSALEGGQMSWALSAITGNPALHFDKTGRAGQWRAIQDNYYTEEEFTDEQFFNFLWKLRRNGAFICCAGIAQMDRKGLIDGHAYSITKLQKVQADLTSGSFLQMVQIRNPHGGGEWQGAWSDKSVSWNQFPSVRDALLGAGGGKEDGSFWMQWQDFVKFWKGVQVVDCESNIRTVATPVYDEESCCGPVQACLLGCGRYWCCCLGLQRLYIGRAGAKDIAGMKQDMDKNCGIDQEGCYCRLCERKAVEYSDDEMSLVSSEG